MTVVAILIGLALLALAVWVWRLDPTPRSGLSAFPAAHIPGYTKVLSVLLALVGVAWLVFLLLEIG